MKTNPSVTIIIPCRNEKKFISRCLDSILANNFPLSDLEVIIVDGMSEDGSRIIIEEYMTRYPFIKLLDNPRKVAPTALNLGIRKAIGEIIIRMDAHSTYSKQYISHCVRGLKENRDIDNVGGVWFTLPGKQTIIARSIAFTLSHPFGVGNSYFRIGLKKRKYVDTVPFGCYSRTIFKKIGLFNENLVRNQDLEFNSRLIAAGGKILLDPEIKSYYYARSNLKTLCHQNFNNGCWIIYSLLFAKLPFSSRHLIPAIFVSALFLPWLISFIYPPLLGLSIITLSIYCIAAIFFSFQLSLKKGLQYFPFAIIIFAALHLSYGIGSIWGSIKLFAAKSRLFVKKTA